MNTYIDNVRTYYEIIGAATCVALWFAIIAFAVWVAIQRRDAVRWREHQRRQADEQLRRAFNAAERLGYLQRDCK